MGGVNTTKHVDTRQIHGEYTDKHGITRIMPDIYDVNKDLHGINADYCGLTRNNTL